MSLAAAAAATVVVERGKWNERDALVDKCDECSERWKGDKRKGKESRLTVKQWGRSLSCQDGNVSSKQKGDIISSRSELKLKSKPKGAIKGAICVLKFCNEKRMMLMMLYAEVRSKRKRERHLIGVGHVVIALLHHSARTLFHEQKRTAPLTFMSLPNRPSI